MLTEEEKELAKRYGFHQIPYSHFPDDWYARNGSRWNENELKRYLCEVERITRKVKL